MKPLFIPSNWNKYNIYCIANRLIPLGWKFKEATDTGEKDKFEVPVYSYTFTSVSNEYAGYLLKFVSIVHPDTKMHAWKVDVVKEASNTKSDTNDNTTGDASSDSSEG